MSRAGAVWATVLCALVAFLLIEAYWEQARHDRGTSRRSPRSGRTTRPARPTSRLRIAYEVAAGWVLILLAAAVEHTARRPARHRRPQ